MSIVCNCPICPLVTANAQVCNVKITFTKDGYRFQATREDGITDELLRHQNDFMILAATARNNYKLKKGQTWDEETRNDCEFHIECLRKNQFKVCFHAKKKPEVLEDPTSS